MDGVNCPLLQLVLESGRFFSKLGRVLETIAPWYDNFLSLFSFCQGQLLLVEQVYIDGACCWFLFDLIGKRLRQPPPASTCQTLSRL